MPVPAYVNQNRSSGVAIDVACIAPLPAVTMAQVRAEVDFQRDVRVLLGGLDSVISAAALANRASETTGTIADAADGPQRTFLAIAEAPHL